MADHITVKMDPSSKSFTPCPAGSQHAVCVDVIDLGWTVDQYKDQPARVIRKVALVFQTDEENPDTTKRWEPSIEFTVAQEFTDEAGQVKQVATFGERSKLRKFLTSWRGKPYSDEEAITKGAPLDKLEGQNAILGIIHKTSKQERVYAVIDTVQPPLKNMVKLVPNGYKRSEHWDRRKVEYKDKLEKYRASAPAPKETNFEDFPAALEGGDDDLPF